MPLGEMVSRLERALIWDRNLVWAAFHVEHCAGSRISKKPHPMHSNLKTDAYGLWGAHELEPFTLNLAHRIARNSPCAQGGDAGSGQPVVGFRNHGVALAGCRLCAARFTTAGIMRRDSRVQGERPAGVSGKLRRARHVPRGTVSGVFTASCQAQAPGRH